MKVLVTGAQGFVGRNLVRELLKAGHEVIASARHPEKEKKRSHTRLKWIRADLLQPALLPPLEEVDQAYYLIHGLKAQERIFEYEESVSAVNFINWVRPTGCGVIYLGALGQGGFTLSPHLRSRQLTGAILGASGLSVKEFRASIILGAGSLSFEMIKALTLRLPFRPDFSLLREPCQPLSEKNLLEYLLKALEHQEEGHRIWEIGGPDVTSYGELLDLYAELAGKKRRIVRIPDLDVKILEEILDYALPEYAMAGKKMTESLVHPTVVQDEGARKAFPDIRLQGIREAMEVARRESKTHYGLVWEKDFLKLLLSDKVLGDKVPFSEEILRSLEKVGRLKDIIARK